MKSYRPNFKLMYFVIFFFGLFGLAKSSWAANWYVEPNATGTGAGTSWTNAWTSFSVGSHPVVWGSGGVQAGDTLYISGGSTSQTYTATADNMFHPTVSGTASQPITIRVGQDAGHNGQVIFDGAGTYGAMLNTGYQNYIIVDGSVGGVTKWRITNSSLTDDTKSLAAGHNSIGNIIRYIQMDTGTNGIYMNFATLFEIDHLTIYAINNDFVILAAGSDGPLGANKIHNCDFTVNYDPTRSGCGPDTIRLTYSTDIYNNTFRTTTGTTIGCQHPDFIQPDWHKVRIYNNLFLGALNSIMHEGWPGTGPSTIDDFQLYNNVFIHAGNGGVQLTTGDNTATVNRMIVANNTFVDNRGDNALTFEVRQGTTSIDARFENNIFYNNGTPGNGVSGWMSATAGQCSSIIFDHNLLNAGAHGAAPFTCNGVPFPNLDGQTGSPSFVSYTEDSINSDLRLTPGSPAKDHGTDLSFLEITPLVSDINGNARPQGIAWDIGAYEYVGATPPPDTTPPAAPTGLRIR